MSAKLTRTKLAWWSKELKMLHHLICMHYMEISKYFLGQLHIYNENSLNSEKIISLTTYPIQANKNEILEPHDSLSISSDFAILISLNRAQKYFLIRMSVCYLFQLNTTVLWLISIYRYNILLSIIETFPISIYT